MRTLFDAAPHYYSPGRNYEVDFLLQNGMQIIPVECKAGGNVKSASFKRYRREEKPGTRNKIFHPAIQKTGRYGKCAAVSSGQDK